MRSLHTLIVALLLAAATQISTVPVSGEESDKSSAKQEQPADTTNAEHRAESPTPFDRKRFDAEVTSRKDLPNFHEVHPFLYRSGEPSREGMLEAKAKGISTLIDLRAPSECKFDEGSLAKQMGIKYINLPMSSKAPTKKQVAVFLDTVKDAQQHPENGAVLVHCAHGSDRTGCLVGMWRVTQEGWPYEKAYAEMRKYWFGPKFTNLAGAVRERCHEQLQSAN